MATFCKSCGNKLSSSAGQCSNCGSGASHSNQNTHQNTVHAHVATSNGGGATAMVVSARNKKIGLWLLIGPWAGLIGIMVAWAIVSFVISSVVASSPASSDVVNSGAAALGSGDVRTTVARIVNVALGFFGILCVVGIIAGIPLGIMFLKKREPADHTSYDSRSGHNDASVIPEDVSGWSWGAAGLPILWGIYYNVWVALWCFIPVISIPVRIYLGVKGNELAWKRNKWTSVEAFKKAQKKWQIWGILGFIFTILGLFSYAK